MKSQAIRFMVLLRGKELSLVSKKSSISLKWKRKGRDTNDPCLWRETSQTLIIFRLTKTVNNCKISSKQ